MFEKHPLLRTRDVPLPDLKKVANSGRLFAVVDASSVPLIPKKVLEVGQQRAVSLYRGTAEEEFWEVAPYLVTVDESFVDWLQLNAKKEGWGIFIASRSDLEEMRRHLRHFLKVQSPRDEIWLFRFYDPRVLEFFLQTFSVFQLRAFFGPVQAYGITDLDWKAVHFVQEAPSTAPPIEMRPYFRLLPEQEKHFDKYSELIFIRQTVLYVKEQHADKVEGMADAIITERVKVAIARAKSFGLKLKESILFFVALMFDIAPNFYEQPGIRRALTTSNDSPDVRMDELLDNTSEDDWDQAEENYDEEKWQERP